MNKLDEYLKHMHNIVKQEVSQADSKIGWRITFIGTLITLFSLLLGIGVTYFYIIPFIIFLLLELGILLIFGLWPRYKINENNKNLKENTFSIYSFLFFINNSEKEIYEKLEKMFNGKLDSTCLEILDQIIINSNIADKKYQAFKHSFLIFLPITLFKK